VPLRHYAALLKEYVSPYKGRLGLLAVSMLCGTGLNLLTPQVLRYFIDTAVADGPIRYLVWAGIAFLGLGIGRQVVEILSSYVGQDLGWRATNEMRNRLAFHCLNLDMDFHHDRTPGEMIERVDGDTTALATFFSQFVLHVIGGAVFLFGVIVVVFFEDWRVGFALAVFSAVAFAILNLTRNIAVPIYGAEREGYARLFGFLEERLVGLEDLRTNGAVGYALDRFHRVNRQVFDRVKKSELMNELLRAITGVVFALGYAMAMAMGIWLYNDGTFTIGTVFLVFHYTSMLREPLFLISRQINELQRATAGLKRIEELHGIETAIRGGRQKLPEQHPLGVRFDRVTFAYNPPNRVLEDVSFTLDPGKTLGLLGKTGSGKTTMTRLLFRLYDLDDGDIRLGGRSIKDVCVDELRGHVGLVTQDVQLFNASVRENLTLFQKGIPDRKIIGTLEDLGLQRWFQSLPDGLDSELASGSSGLSAGEAQLLAFARVFLRDPGLVVLDEPSSRLDPATERAMNFAVDRLLENRTGIIIAHRLETLQKVDDILILEKGRIREHGRRSDLVSNPDSQFSKLLKAGVEEVIA